jgi:hypothetical protein
LDSGALQASAIEVFKNERRDGLCRAIGQCASATVTSVFSRLPDP